MQSGCFKARDFQSGDADVLERDLLAVELLGDVHRRELVAGLRHLRDRRGDGVVLHHADVVQIDDVGVFLLQIIDKGDFDFLAFVFAQVDFAGVDFPVAPHVRAILVFGHTTVAHLLFVLDVENHRGVARGAHVDDGDLEGVLLLREHGVSGCFPVERELVGVVEVELGGDQVVFARAESVAGAIVVGGRVQVNIVKSGHCTTGGGVVSHRPFVAQGGARVSCYHGPSVGHVERRFVRLG